MSFIQNVLICLGVIFIHKSQAALYNATDDVTILNNGSFYQTIVNSDIAWNVEFYNSWCGHCIHFAPKYKKIATDTKGWRQAIAVAAIDCSERINVDICNSYKIQGYPSMRLIPPKATKYELGLEYYNQDVEDIKGIMVDFLTNLTIHNQAPKNCPYLLPLQFVEHIWSIAKDEHKHLLLIFEKETSYIGRQVILDMSMNTNILIRRMSPASMVKFGIRDYPSIYLLTRDGRFKRLAKYGKTRASFVKAIRALIGENPTHNERNEVQPVQQQHSVKPPPASKHKENGIEAMQKAIENVKQKAEKMAEKINAVDKKSYAVHMQDLESTLSYCFRQEISIRQEIEGEQLEALKHFIRVLAKYFPGREEVSSFLRKISRWLDGITELLGSHWSHYIHSLQTMDSFLPDKIQWIGCHGSEPQFRGYPCGMWTLFHTLTVNSYIYGKDSPKFLYKDVLYAISGYMKYFFGCSYCSKHFSAMAASIDSEVSSPEDLVLWLWQAHNKVNKRLHGDPSEDPKHPKIQFPPQIVCPKCYRDDSSQKWDKDHVLSYLIHLYESKNIINIPDDENNIPNNIEFQKTQKGEDWWEKVQRSQNFEKLQEMRQQKREKSIQKRKNVLTKIRDVHERKNKSKEVNLPVVGFVSRTDVGLCAFYYVLCVSIIIALYYHFFYKKRCKSKKPVQYAINH